MSKAYRDPGSPGTVSLGSTVQQLTYDAQGRRIVQQVMNSADLNHTEHYYHAGQSVVEIRNGSGLLLKQQLFAGMFNIGDGYVDQLLQIALNEDPFATDGSEDECEAFFYALHDANYNLLALVDEDGAIAERYEYTPYGQRTVYFSPGPNDPLAMAPTTMSRRWDVGGVEQPYGLNTIGHQGLSHDEVTGLVYNRARMLHPRMGRFMQRDPFHQDLPGGGYQDGMNLYLVAGSEPVSRNDPSGLRWIRLGLPESPAKCGLVLALINEAAEFDHVNRMLWSHYKHGRGVDKELDFAYFDTDNVRELAKSDTELLWRDRSLGAAAGLQCGQNRHYHTGPISRRGSYQSDHRMINLWRFSGKFTINIEKQCGGSSFFGLVGCECKAVAKVSYRFSAFDTTDFNPGQSFNLPPFRIEDDLVNKCNLGTDFDIRSISFDSAEWSTCLD